MIRLILELIPNSGENWDGGERQFEEVGWVSDKEEDAVSGTGGVVE